MALQCWPVKLKSPLHPTAQSVPFHYENVFNPQREHAVPCRVRGTRLPSNRTHLCPIHSTSKELPQNSLGSHLLMSPLPFIPTPFLPPPPPPLQFHEIGCRGGCIMLQAKKWQPSFSHWLKQL